MPKRPPEAHAGAEEAAAGWNAMTAPDGTIEPGLRPVPEVVLSPAWDDGEPPGSTAGAGRPDRAGARSRGVQRGARQDKPADLAGAASMPVASDGSGIMSLVQSKDITYERLPMLEVVFDRLERILTTSVRNFTSENVEISLENISVQRFSDYMGSVSLPAMIAIHKALEWDN